ncbi:tRNA (adenosine(37)-N6)-threonylcarbamoyltransferase complex dimerization subunit type 1 TsaB [Macrococcoides bohemicum]|uniref:tRNA (Adenosine(37)-N6)-threonylcarbamoyltransferase complex dimerization subunit type 1 TsaB n=1 Tax=Macrococcoides bohemicum TaxID=1903056 RepID=A0A4R5XQG7_9STAP|nr:tRNA (adenosine(37)-N6)-threonylcarbamoyltransferase complex dimerization subunit type 1 TsaB [Macrococcus bohemicus]MBC9875701.1 tRNA (adenosine(37)-N6)-threonylcarbamoyltransferase complex dimerization subunit type 1 TsaB [Macrococcus bohemicus]QRN50641.1 tRNA (adenosine(37)-N6)-threonylcarbamoyltransferase complex dimerization subunit type 1 TsaB [Macrococcus bohemicus]QYA42108.1 tRNA (adenosine(37)-N6)-threonylcarbamoyltransferase complex dimerization subunit type 1 TsaB [Macrococcus bohe
MRLLHIDTSNQPLSVAITEGNEVLAEFNSGMRINHSITMMSQIESLLEYTKLEMKDIEGIVVAKGPGSYTGLRIGVTAAKTLAYTLNIPLYAVSSLAAIAATVRMHEFLLVPVIDARRNHVYAGIYRYKGVKLELVEDDTYISIDDLNQKLKEQHLPYLFIGMDAEKLAEQLKGPSYYCIPRSAEMRRLINESSLVSAHTFEPTYLRISEAERNWQNNQA